MHAATEAQAGLDMLLASRSFASDMGIDIGDHIFVAGYSQGGHGAMALHKAIQDRPTDDLWVTASAPMSGPYSISGVMKDLILGEEAYDSDEKYFGGHLLKKPHFVEFRESTE